MDVEREPALGFGHQIGPLEPRYGPDWAPLQCDVCKATWIGPIGEWCSFCTTWNERAERNQIPKPKAKADFTYEQLLAVFEAAGPNGHKPGDMAGDNELRALLINWPLFWAKDHSEAEWLAEPLIPSGRSVALFAPGGTGKSLLALWLAAGIATGTPIFGTTQPPRRVLYLDYEMTEDDLAERLETMGYADVDLQNLHYALLPSLPGLDQREGGEAICRLAELCDAELVIIDTFGRAVHGDENDADTVRAWYRFTGIHLKNAGRAFVRVDHAGKDLAKGQRGTSAKNDDVDIVWQMTVKDDSSFTLTARKRRMSWVPETVNLHLDDNDLLHFARLDIPPPPPGTNDTATLLDQYGADPDITVSQAVQLLRDHGTATRKQVVAAAVKHRRQAVENLLGTCGQPAGTAAGTDLPPKWSGTDIGTAYDPKPNTLLDDLGTETGTDGNRSSGQGGSGGWLPVGEPPEPRPNPIDPLADLEEF